MYDGSASSNDDPSLNDCLQVGPNLIPKLFNVLIQFRCHQVTLVADVEKAFLMVSIAEEDRDMLRFLWLKDPLMLHSEIIRLRFARLVFGLKLSPAILGAVLSLHLAKYHCEYPQLVDRIDQSLCVGDLVSGGANVQEAFELYKTAKHIMHWGGFNLRKWNSNSSELLRLIGEAEYNLSKSTTCKGMSESSPESTDNVTDF